MLVSSDWAGCLFSCKIGLELVLTVLNNFFMWSIVQEANKLAASSFTNESFKCIMRAVCIIENLVSIYKCLPTISHFIPSLIDFFLDFFLS